MAGDYFLYQRRYGNLTTDVLLTGLTATYPGVMVPRNQNYQVYIQKAMMMITTYVACVVTFVGSVSGNVYARFDVPASAPNVGEDISFPLDFGPAGLSLIVVGDSINVSLTNASLTGYIHIEGYQKLANVIGAYNPDFAAGTAGLQ